MNDVNLRPLLFFGLLLVFIAAERISRRHMHHPMRQGSDVDSPTDGAQVDGVLDGGAQADVKPKVGIDLILWRHFANNSFLLILSTLLVRSLPILGLGAAALWAEHQQLGLFQSVELPYWLVVGLSILILDALVYWQHRLFHRVPFLWRLHKVHHSDPAVDVSSALRFHPLEILLSQLIKIFAVILLALPLDAVVLFEILLSSFALLAHSQLYFGPRVEKVLPWFIASPAMHRVHHSCIRAETDSNYTTILSVWDRLFGSYRAPVYGENIRLGLIEYLHMREPLGLWALLCMPFIDVNKTTAKAKAPMGDHQDS